MCRIEERVYVGMNGSRQAFEEVFKCENSRNNRLCPNVKRKTVEYLSRPPQVHREDNSSPASYNPPTPTGSSSYILEERGPATSGRRPSIGQRRRVIEPKIIIEIGSKKEKAQQYPKSSSRSYKRSSLGAGSIGSNDVPLESPGSEASYTLRTGFPEDPVPPSGSPAYLTRAAAPRGHSHTRSSSSFTDSNQIPSLYAASDSETPSARFPQYPTVVHNHSSEAFPPSSSRVSETAAKVPSSPYRTTTAVPKTTTETVGTDGIFPVDYSAFQSHSNLSHINPTISPESDIQDEELVRLQKLKIKTDKASNERANYGKAQAVAKDEEARQVRFELGRAEARAQERAARSYAEHEKRRAEGREEARRQREMEQNQREEAEARAERRLQELEEQAAETARRNPQQEAHERAAKAARRDAQRLQEEISRKEREIRDAESRLRDRRRDSRPPTRYFTKQSRRRSMSQHEVMERGRLLAEEEARMTLEREATERRELEEQTALLREQQQQPRYWDPRGGSRIPIPHKNPGMSRRNSVSGRRDHTAVVAPPTVWPDLSRRTSQRVTIVNPTPPSPNLPPASKGVYSARHNPAPHPSYNTHNPFAHPPTLAPTAGLANPIVRPVRDQGDILSREAATHHHVHRVRPNSDDRHHHSLHRRGEDFIERTAEFYRARQASQKMGRVVGFEDDYDEDSDSEYDRMGGKKTGKGKRSL